MKKTNLLRSCTGIMVCIFLLTATLSSGAQTFHDVSAESWYYEAVTAMSEAGLVGGMGDGTFAPESTLTYAQFCQIVARAKNLPTGEANGYWAGKAIQACIDAKYIFSLGALSAANYDAPITREAAVAAMFKTKEGSIEVGTQITSPMIPDYHTIDSRYRLSIIAAYNSGITSGIDEILTFNPKGLLKRAEVCQLFYNIGW